MIRHLCLITAILTLTPLVVRADAPPTVPWSELKNHIGQVVQTEGPAVDVLYSAKSKCTYIHIGDKTVMLVVQKTEPDMSQSLGQDQHVRATGRVAEDADGVRIIVNSPADVEIK